jgi:hypothetical protein
LGLDNFVSRSSGEVVLTPEDERAIGESDVSLCGGMCGDGVTSFRSKVHELFRGGGNGRVALCQEWLPPETVVEMADKVDACDPDTARERLDLDADFMPSPGEIRDLRRLFRVCADRGLGIIAWSSRSRAQRRPRSGPARQTRQSPCRAICTMALASGRGQRADGGPVPMSTP